MSNLVKTYKVFMEVKHIVFDGRARSLCNKNVTEAWLQYDDKTFKNTRKCEDCLRVEADLIKLQQAKPGERALSAAIERPKLLKKKRRSKKPELVNMSIDRGKLTKWPVMTRREYVEQYEGHRNGDR